MAEYAILRFSKHKASPAGALEAHHERTKDKYASNPDIDISKSKDNFHIITPKVKYRKEIDNRIKANNCKTRKDSTMFVDTLITASPTFFDKKSKKEVAEYFTEAVKFMTEKLGQENIFSAVVHLDEKSPHMHLCFTPITKDGRLSAKDILGNRANLSKWQDEFHKFMKQKYPTLERGESSLITKRKHIPTRLLKQTVNLSKQQKLLENAIADINMFNAGKKREEAINIIKSFFPKMQAHLGEMKKYQETINYLSQENRTLIVKANKRQSIAEQFDAVKIKQENENLKALLEQIPPQLLQELTQMQNQQKSTHTKGGDAI